MITLKVDNFEHFRPLLDSPNIHTPSEQPAEPVVSPCSCSREYGTMLIGMILLGGQEDAPKQEIHICNVCHTALVDNGQTPIPGKVSEYLEEVVRQHGTVHVFFNTNARQQGLLTTALETIHEVYNGTQGQEAPCT
jgi:hypothetical protein